jgi:DNA repair exonuclease SbcCD ATPase subunit
MIRLKNITLRNFLSVGNVTQAVNLENSNLTLVLGENLDLGGNDSGSRNGVGKTALTNAISYALYGQALSNIRKDNLINRTNEKGLLVTLEFECSGQSYRIERGRRPGVMKFYVGDQEQKCTDDAQGDSRETQHEIDRLLNMSHDMFRHIVALNTYTEPFLSLRANDQRAIIEQLLGITLLSEKADQLKELNRNVKDMIMQEEFRIRTQQEFNQKIRDQINSLKLKQSSWQQRRDADLNKYQTAIDQLSKLDIDQEIANHGLKSQWLEDRNYRQALAEAMSTLTVTIKAQRDRADRLERQIVKLLEHRCPECDQELHNGRNAELREEKTQQLAEIRDHLKSLGSDMIAAQTEQELLPELVSEPQVYYRSLDEAYTHRSQLSNLQTQYNTREQETDPYQEQIDELSDTGLTDIDYGQINEYRRLLDHQEFLLKILTNKDSFVRKKIIDQNLSYLNQRLSHYLDRIGLPHTVVFQNDLTVSITELGRDLDFDNLSRGERNRLILSLSWAFRDVWESLYQPINFLIVDELIDSGMDTVGVENSLAILKGMTRDRGKTVFLISHREELSARVTNILSVVKENGFTTFNHLDNV